MNESLFEACARAIFELVAKDNEKLTWVEFSGIIQNMNNGVFGKYHNMPTKRVEIQRILREYVESQRQIQDDTICDTCGCTPCDCHWGII